MLKRRTFFQATGAAALGRLARAETMNRFAVARMPAEWTYTTAKKYADPFHEVELDVVFRGSAGEHRVAAFWAGGSEWRVP